MMKIAFYDAKPYDRVWFDEYVTEYGYKIKYIESRLSLETTVLAKGYDAVCIFVNDTVTKDVIDELSVQGVKAILLRCAGFNNVDFEAAYKKIHVMRVPAYSPFAVAEYACALLLSVNRKTHRAYARTRDFNFNINGLMGMDLHGKTAGVVGTGKIGRIMIDILRGFGMHILAHGAAPCRRGVETQRLSAAAADSRLHLRHVYVCRYVAAGCSRHPAGRYNRSRGICSQPSALHR